MNHAVAFFAGSITFVVVMLLKIPIKWGIVYIAERSQRDEPKKQKLRKRLNGILFPIVFLVALISYYIVLQFLGSSHFKLCCSLKAGAFAIAFYSIFEQWFGQDDRETKGESK